MVRESALSGQIGGGERTRTVGLYIANVPWMVPVTRSFRRMSRSMGLCEVHQGAPKGREEQQMSPVESWSYRDENSWSLLLASPHS